MLWVIWLLSILAVMAIKVHTTRTVIRVRSKLADSQKRAAKLRMEEKVARADLEIVSRSLTTINRAIGGHQEVINKITQELEQLERAKSEKLKETRKVLLG